MSFWVLELCQIETINTSFMTQFTPRQQNILDFIGQKGEATNQEILGELEKKGDLISRETLVRELNALAERNAIAKTGKGRGVTYSAKNAHPLLVPLDVEKYLAQEVDVRAPKPIPFNDPPELPALRAGMNGGTSCMIVGNVPNRHRVKGRNMVLVS